MILTISLSSISLIAGYVIGTLIHKRKRDKQIASICAERLLRKPEVPSSIQQPSGGMYANAAGMVGDLLGNSALGSNSGLAQSQSQFGNNSVLSGILGEL